jgi:uncharacterized protein YgbK (DUF1537 family)
MRRVLLIADDLTGAADSGVQFARAGWRTLLVLHHPCGGLALKPGSRQDADVLALTSESRGLADGTQAAQAVRSALVACSSPSFPLVYKKIDSTLRGHPAAELAAVMDVLGEARALIAPAFPAQGRTTLGGRVMVNGLPLEQTSFGREVPTGDLRRILGEEAALLPLETIRSGEPRLRVALRGAGGMLIADGKTEDDLLLLARAALAEDIHLWCGSAGLAGALATCMGAKPSASTVPPHPTLQPSGHFLVVAGSLHPATTAQVAAARRAGAVVVQPPPEFFTSPRPQGVAETAARLTRALAGGGDTVLSVLSPADLRIKRDPNKVIYGYTKYLKAVSPAQIAARLAQTAALALETAAPAGLFLTGGETARAVCQALDCTHLWLGGEVEPGMPWSRMADGRFPGLLVVTKAGGFGTEESLVHALNYFDF